MTDLFTEKVFAAYLIPLLGLMFGFDSSKIITALIFLVVFDFITGIFSAKISGEPIRSESVIRSAYKLAVYGLLVSAGHLTEQITPFSTYIEEAVTTFLALTELISIIENIGKMGFAVPKKLLNQLHRLREEETTVLETKVTSFSPSADISKQVVEEKITQTHVTDKPAI